MIEGEEADSLIVVVSGLLSILFESRSEDRQSNYQQLRHCCLNVRGQVGSLITYSIKNCIDIE